MYKRYLSSQTNLKKEYTDLKKLFDVEGGEYYSGRKLTNYYIIVDFRTLSDFLKEDEMNTLITEYKFTNKTECMEYINNLENKVKKWRHNEFY